MKDLVLITARGGSKGIPGKNIKLLNGRPLIYYTLDSATAVAMPDDICVSTDSEEIIRVVRDYGLDVPFTRPACLATDTASSYDVIRHAIDFYRQKSIDYDRLILLQPTSPFRTAMHIREALTLYETELDMVVSVKVTCANPYFTLFEENRDGFLESSKPGNFTRRQDCPAVYEYNGAIYIMNVQSLKKVQPANFTKIRKYVMGEVESIDLDSQLNWVLAEAVIFCKNR